MRLAPIPSINAGIVLWTVPALCYGERMSHMTPGLLNSIARVTGAPTPECEIDFETYSECDLKECGATVYAQHPSTEIICMSYKFDDMPHAIIWVPEREPFPQRIIDHINAGGVMMAHNAGFECAIWRYVCVPRMGLPWPKFWRDTMAEGAYRALPLKLDEQGRALRLKIQKNPRGRFLINKLCKPQRPNKEHPEPWRCRDPALLEEFYGYCCTDTDVEHELGKKIGPLPKDEYRIWVLDQRINLRGVNVDMDAVYAAQRLVEEVEHYMLKELRAITDEKVQKAGELKKIQAWLQENNFPVANLQAATIDDLLDDEEKAFKLPPKVKRVLEIRRTLSKASTKKLYKYLSCTANDGRIHGLLQYYGASTGRWAGRLLQPQNFPRGDEDILKSGMDVLIEYIKHGDLEVIELIWGDPMEAIASALRGMIVAGEGNTLYVADFSSIEARVLAWIADEKWKIKAFEEGREIYCETASMIFKRPITKKENPVERGVGKVCELAFGYQGGLGAWRKFDRTDKWTDDQVNEHKDAWREAHPGVVNLWWGLERAAISAVLSGKPQRCSVVTFQTVVDAAGQWLTCRLPNGRLLWYYAPWVDTYEYRGKMRHTLHYEGRDNKKGGKWGDIQTYGGMLTENVVQAISRDLMVEAMIRIELANYPIILTIHDEIVAETKKDFGSKEEFDRLMTIVPEWAKGCPVNAAGWTGYRYHKE